MRWIPRTLFGQIALTLLIGVLFTQLIGLWLLVNDRGQINYKLLSEYAAQRTAGIAIVLDSAAPEERQLLVNALSVEPTTLLLTLPWFPEKLDTSLDAKLFAKQVERHLDRPLVVQMLSIERVDPLMFELHPWPRERKPRGLATPEETGARLFPRTYVAQIRLRDETVVTFHHVLPTPLLDLPYRIIGILLLVGFSVISLSIWSVRRLTMPLASLADAATGLAKNLNRPPLSEDGPQEIRQAAQAFNAMQHNLRRMIDTRAQALSAVSHDLRLPITRARLRLESDMTPSTRDMIKRDLAEMDTMIGHTLDYLRSGTTQEKMIPVNLDALIDSVVDDMEELGASVLRNGGTSRPIMAGPHALRRCMSNIMDNARIYGEGVFSVVVEDRNEDVQIEVSDRGPGISSENIDRVFEPYFRIESSRSRHTGGTGLGLSIARAIVEAHGGSISLRSSEGKGVTVAVTIPRRSTTPDFRAY